jgi:hypothetical protein
LRARCAGHAGSTPCAPPPLARIVLARSASELALQLGIAAPAAPIEAPVGQRGLHGAAGLGLVGTIAEAAALRQRLDIRKGRGHPGIGLPEAQLAHARGVQNEAPVGQEHELAMGGGVAPARIVFAGGPGRHQGRAGQRIDEARFARARAAEQRRRAAGREARAQALEPLAGDRRDRVHGHTQGDGLDAGLQGVRARAPGKGPPWSRR